MTFPSESSVGDESRSASFYPTLMSGQRFWSELPFGRRHGYAVHVTQGPAEEHAEKGNMLFYDFLVLLDPSSGPLPSVVTVSFKDPTFSQSTVSQLISTFSWISPQTSKSSHEEAASATVERARPKEIHENLHTLLSEARDELFEDGMETNFSKALISLIQCYGNDAVEVLTEFVVSEQVNPEVASEALRWIGRVEDLSTQQSRLWLLGRSLFSASSRVRDAAVLGLASLNDPEAVLVLEAAIRREHIDELRQDMEQVLNQFRDISGVSFENNKKV